MATIVLSQLAPVGSDLFVDSENYLRELTNTEVSFNRGGSDLIATAVSVIVTLAGSYIASRAIAQAQNDRDRQQTQCVQQ